MAKITWSIPWIPPPRLTCLILTRATWNLRKKVGWSHISAPSESEPPALVITVTSKTWNWNFDLVVEESKQGPYRTTHCGAILWCHHVLRHCATSQREWGLVGNLLAGPSRTHRTLELYMCMFLCMCFFLPWTSNFSIKSTMEGEELMSPLISIIMIPMDQWIG